MIRTILLALVLAGFATTGASVAATVKDAEAAMAGGRHADAVSILKPLAASGDADAQTLMGGILLAGLGVPRDTVAAHDMLILAAKQGQPFAQYNLAVMYHHGDAGRVDVGQARQWYSLAAEGGVPPAMAQWAFFLLEGRGGAPDPVEGRRWAERAANFGEPAGQYLMGVLTANGAPGTPPDLQQAYVWLLLAERSGFKPAAENIGILKHRLTAEERTKAEQSADAWRPTANATDKR